MSLSIPCRQNAEQDIPHYRSAQGVRVQAAGAILQGAQRHAGVEGTAGKACDRHLLPVLLPPQGKGIRGYVGVREKEE